MSWEMVKLSNIAEIIAGQSPESKFYNSIGDGIPFYQGKADFGLDYPTTRYWCSKPTKIAKSKDILVSVRAPVGPTNICEHEACIGRGLVSVRSTEKVYYKFLYYYFKTIEEKLTSLGNGSTFSAVTTNVIKDLQIPLPPLATQKRIAEILDAADALRRKDQELLKKYDELAQAIFIDMFGDPVKNEKGWEKVAISHYIKRLDTGVSVNSNDEDVNSTKKCVLKTSCVYTGYFAPNEAKVIVKEEINRARLNPVKDSIIISRMNTSELVGMSAYINKDYPNLYLPDRLWMTVKSNNYHSSLWLSFALKSLAVREQIFKIASGTSGSMKNISKKDFLNIRLINPPFNLQKKFEVALSVINSSKEISVNFKSYLLFESLLQKSFKGELVA